uniref:Reverse transcriptase domain-containing protein n=1 Tax=Tanacetum cinerariifolium TaxID=118510 RepID=A0A699HM71_TANCI|nr:reverse transcriptase domain-containing protein [Tanacetum cinerariifolium]
MCPQPRLQVDTCPTRERRKSHKTWTCPLPIAALREYCDRNYHQLLPIIAEKVHQDKVQQEKLKAVKACFIFEEVSQHSKPGTPSERRDLRKRLGSKRIRIVSGSPKSRHGQPESPRKRDPKRKTMFKRLEKGLFQRLRDKGKSMFAHSNDSRHQSYHSSRRDTETCYQSSRSRGTEPASKKHHNKTEALTQDGSFVRNYDDLKEAFLANFHQQKKCIKDPVEIHHIKQREGESTEDFVRRFKVESRDVKGASKIMRILGFMHGITNPELIKRLHDKISKSIEEMMRITTSFLRGRWQLEGSAKSKQERGNIQNLIPTSRRKKGNRRTNDHKSRNWRPLHTPSVRRWRVNFRNTVRTLLSRLRPEIKNQMVSATAPLIWFSGEIIWPLGKLSLLVKIGDEEHSTSAWMNFMVVRSLSPYNGIIERPGVRKIQAVPSTVHEMLKFHVAGGVVTLRSSKIIPIECATVFRPEGQPLAVHQAIEERIKKPADMSGVPRHIAEHRLNIREGCPPVRKKRRSQAADRNHAIQEEVE